ncbi:hypothetical protein ACFP47_00060 [Nesterenkonia lacusekhoensis]|uniref:DUF485 domain-containing protein n=1 Tax=Nesterenkonia lacusekhoensis TaxID=150832 RepID=A0ABS4T3V9_9MICC|nr:hypothetical protein [Nesterenkonia lacusekhoensis]MBP2319093.1 hypothetical protein [Nesterenkonia lacusekhoensis]
MRAEPEVQDTPAEVDAAFRTLRRVAVTYFIVFLAVVAAFPVLTMTVDWWTESRLLGELSPAFLAAAVGLYVVFVVIGVAAATLSSSVEARMLGGTGSEQEELEHFGADPDADPFASSSADSDSAHPDSVGPDSADPYWTDQDPGRL